MRVGEGGTISISLNVKYALGDERTRRRKKKLKKNTIVRPTANSKEWLTKATGPGVWCWEVRSKRVVPEFMRAGIYGKTYSRTPRRRQVGKSSWKRLTLKNRELFAWYGYIKVYELQVLKIECHNMYLFCKWIVSTVFMLNINWFIWFIQQLEVSNC